MSENVDFRATIRFHGDEARARAVQAAVTAVLLHEEVVHEIPTCCEVMDDGMYVVRAETDPGSLLVNGWSTWGSRLEAQIAHTVADLAPDARVTFDWGVPDQGVELSDLVGERGRRLPTELVDPPVDWADLANRLANVLAAMPDFAYLTLRAADGRYVQVVSPTGEMYCEVASNHSLDPNCRMSAAQQALMSEQGWSAPLGNGTVNWSKELHQPVAASDRTALAEDVVRALSTALAIPAPTDLQVQAWRDGLSQAFAVEVLGLSRLPRPLLSRIQAYTPPRKRPTVIGLASRLRWALFARSDRFARKQGTD
ncbi:hypothetical protein AB0L82_39270 [Nocardia sp. NPDC052001]|uniref:TY-Chap domain-containing protein n=1 Tax=Nocardia sp. NPDC052001 TaxID=3154853 RepID=UPI003425840D